MDYEKQISGLVIGRERIFWIVMEGPVKYASFDTILGGGGDHFLSRGEINFFFTSGMTRSN